MLSFPENFVSVDVETAGPNPSQYSLLSIGACLVSNPTRGFYIELQPVNRNAIPEALAISQLSLDELAARGMPPMDALREFEVWLAVNAPNPVFLAFNAPFDWMFVADYFHRFLGHNPFGHAALDIKAYFMGAFGVTWDETRMRAIMARLHLPATPLTHNALSDAQDQARLFGKILEAMNRDARDM
ncbi:MAG: 3'-5' exonuclease [Chloroflexi bacterium]|nr:3'-5' exonuclease [Chloroflexota bacterium]